MSPDAATPPLPPDVRRVRERAVAADIPLHVHPDWERDFPWLVQGTTGRGRDGFDLGLFGTQPVGAAMERWRRLRHGLDMPRAIHAYQVHGAEVLEHGPGPPGLHVSDAFDGHLTSAEGVLLTVSVADCVPISLVAPGRRAVALLHGGWRGTAAGVLMNGLRALAERPDQVHVHLGPAICGRCYEVGPEVHEALGLSRPTERRPVDVRAVQAGQALAAGVPPRRITVSEHCTRCGHGFFSHRGGEAGRQVGVLGLRP